MTTLPSKTTRRSHHHDVFISSTSKDLPDHRKAAIDAVWRRPVLGNHIAYILKSTTILKYIDNSKPRDSQ